MNDRNCEASLSDLHKVLEVSRAMVADMVKVGTENARGILNHFRAGRFSNEDGTFGQLTRDDGTELAARLIALGNATKAA